MKHDSRSRLTIFLTLWFSGQLAAALPDEVRDVLEKSIAALGGRERLETVEATRQQGVFSVVATGIGGEWEIVHAQPNKFYSRQEIGSIGEIVQAYDGEVGWSRDQIQGFRYLSDEEISTLTMNDGVADSLEYDELYQSGEVLEEGVVDGESVVVLKLIDAATGREEIHSYSVESGLLKRLEMEVDMGPMGKLPVVASIVEYGEADGLLYQKRIKVSNAGMQIDVDFETMEINPAIDASIFAVPE